MKNTGKCPKCGGTHIIRVPDNTRRYGSGNNIYTSKVTLFGKIPVIRYVCYDCGYVEKMCIRDRCGRALCIIARDRLVCDSGVVPVSPD